MNRTEVTREGQSSEAPGRDAVTGANWALPSPNGDGGLRRRRDRDRPMVADESYYGRPIVNGPVWEAREIAGYFFLGGLAGAGSVVAAGAQMTGRTTLATGMKIGSTAAAGLSLAALVKDLGVPSRFYNMLRIVRPTSPMSVGSWLLSGYVPAAAVAAASAVTGRAPKVGAVSTAGAALLGPLVAAYTGALVADTAVPAWHDGHHQMPLLFAASGASAASGLGLIVAPASEAGPVRRLAMVATGAELILERRMHSVMGMTAEPYSQGRAGTELRLARALGAGGALLGALGGRRSRLVSTIAGGALLACLRSHPVRDLPRWGGIGA